MIAANSAADSVSVHVDRFRAENPIIRGSDYRCQQTRKKREECTMPKKEDIEGRGRPDENELAKRYGQIGIKAVAAAARSKNNKNSPQSGRTQGAPRKGDDQRED